MGPQVIYVAKIEDKDGNSLPLVEVHNVAGDVIRYVLEEDASNKDSDGQDEA